MGIALTLPMVAVALALASAASGEIYRWTDAEGRLHFSADLGQVPRSQRAAASRDARPSASPSPERPASSADAPEALARRRGVQRGPLRVPFERRGTLMLVQVELNDRVTAPFLVDTGASGVSIPRAVADQLGAQIGPETDRRRVQTANGIVEEPVIAIDSLQVGDARVETLEAVVSASMEVGLLGGTFFNNFVYQVDSAAGEITLLPNHGVRGGLSQEQWQERFSSLRQALARLDTFLDANGASADPRVVELERRREAVAEALEELEGDARAANVPQAWRHPK